MNEDVIIVSMAIAALGVLMFLTYVLSSWLNDNDNDQRDWLECQKCGRCLPVNDGLCDDCFKEIVR